MKTLTNALVFFMASVFFFSFFVPQQQLSDVIGFVAILTLVVYPAYAGLVRMFPRLQFIKWEADVARESPAKHEPPPKQESHRQEPPPKQERPNPPPEQDQPKQESSPKSREYYCGVLNVNPYASRELIDAAYKAQRQKHHPDKAVGEQAQQWATEKFKEIQEAYEFLSAEAE